MKKYILFILILLQSVFVFGQDFNLNPTSPRIGKRDASISALMRFEDIPADHYTGIPKVTVPICTLPTRSKDITMDVTLGYHPSSVTLYGETAGECGLGWTLFDGGAISRSTFDRPDEMAISLGQDESNDVYQFNFMGNSGRFYLEKDAQGILNMKVLSNKNSKLVINFTYNPTTYVVNTFTIYDDKGYRYEFTDFDTQTYYNESDVASYSYRSAYHLSKVVDNNNKDLLLFSYNPYSKVINASYTDTYKKLKQIVSDGYGKIIYNYNSTSFSQDLRINQIELRDYNNTLVQNTTLVHDGQNLKKVDLRSTAIFYYEFNYKDASFSTSGSYEPDDWGYRVYKPTCFFVYPYQNTEDNFKSVYYTAGVLNQMRMPSGGSVNFDYESNTYSYYTQDANGNWVLQVPHNFYTAEQPGNQVISTLAQKEFLGDGSNTLTFTVPGTTNQYIEYFFNAETTSFSIPGIYDTDGNLAVFHPSFTLNGYGYSNVVIANNTLSNLCLGTSYYLREGQTYTITINAAGGNNINKKGTIIISKKDLNQTPNGIYYGGGIRIRQIAYFDKNIVNYYENKSTFNASGVFPSKELKYSYNFFDVPTRSSGFISSPGSIDELANSRVIREAVGYKNVTITETGKGKQQLTFTSPLDDLISSSSPIGADGTYYDYRRGLLKNRKVFTEQNYLLSDTDFNYGFVEPTTPQLNYSNPALNERVGWAKLTQKISRSYFSNSILPYTVTENFVYDDTIRKLVSSTMVNSLGETLKKQYTYHVGNSAFSQNRIGEPEKVETFRGTDLLFTKKIIYSNAWSGNSSFLPSIMQSSKGSQPLENTSRITAYDEFSNPIEIREENGAFVTYLWGYNRTQIIAQISNASNSDIATALGVGNVTLVNETNMTSINNLRSNASLANAMITTYTHIPLIGVSTVTDAKNDKVTYGYDADNRVSVIKDKNNKILAESLYYDKSEDDDLNSHTTIQYKTETSTPIATPAITDAVTNKVFFDGLGRTIQEIGFQQSNTGKDIVFHKEYDNFGQQTKNYLPYTNTTSSLDYNPNAKTDLLNYPEYMGQYPYSEIKYEESPINRVLEQASPGADWQINNSNKHTIRYDYYVSATGDNVKKLSATADESYYTTLGYYGISIQDAGFYPANELVKTVMKNENWKVADGTNNTIEEFKDKQGRLVLKRVYGVSVVSGIETNTNHDTYMVYDQYGNLTYVLPPKANGLSTTPVLDELCYQYRYDHKNRLVEKKLPGKQWEFIVYDKLNRIKAAGPTLSPFTDASANTYGWLIAKYDGLNRKIISAWQTGTNTSAGRKILQDTYNTTSTPLNELKSTSDTTESNVSFRYTTTSLPTSGYNVLTVDYYDDYNYTGAPATFTTVLNDNSQDVYYDNSALKPKGLLTGSWKRFMEASTVVPVRGELSHVLYDKKARAVRARMVNHLGGYTQLDSKIDFSGKVLFTETKHKRLNADPVEIYVKEVFTYSSQDRLLTHTHQIGTAGTPQVLTQNSYNELGRLVSKKVGNTVSAPLQKVDYSYNIRGWLTEINKVDGSANPLQQGSDPIDLFAFKINYNDPITNDENGTIVPLYNGNIAETTWRTNTDNTLRRYGYKYDHLNRLKSAVYQKGSVVSNSYNESTTYDKNGNIMSMQRNGDFDDLTTTFQMDNLTYKYDLNEATNRLMKVTDATNSTLGFKDDSNGTNDTVDDYTYDANGNMTKDDNKGIASIKYNHLNLPVEIIFSGAGTKKINYLYTATGERRQKIVTNGSTVATTDYLGGFQYLKPTSAGAVALQYFPHAEGYVANTVVSGNNTYNYVFNYTDHLGNVRMTYTKNGTELKILEENHYYPFGLKHTKYNIDQAYYDACFPDNCIIKVTRSPYQYKYNGQEWQDDLGLNVTNMDFRQYDNALGRFGSIDLLAENSMQLTPYHFGNNNPNYWADPTGLNVENLNSGAPWLDAMWEATPENGVTVWSNIGGANFALDYSFVMSGSTGGGGNGSGSGGGGGLSEGDYAGLLGAWAASNGAFNLPGQSGIGNSNASNAIALMEVIVEQKTPANNSDSAHVSDIEYWGFHNFFFGAYASGFENLSGVTRVGTNGTFYTATATGRVFYGNRYVTTYSLRGIGEIAGKASFGFGVVLDGFGVYNYYQDPNSSNIVHPGKMGLNTTMGALGVWGGASGAIVSIMYGAIDQFYPGGWEGAASDQDRLYQENRAINPNYQYFPHGY
jgi:RHS repeat-associated protein